MTYLDRQKIWAALLVFLLCCFAARPTMDWLFFAALALRLLDHTQHDIRRWQQGRRPPYSRGWNP